MKIAPYVFINATGLTWPITITLKTDASGTRIKFCFTLIACLPTALAADD
jgi:hypothetical protein